MRVLYHIPHPKGVGADRWIYEGWRDAFKDLGIEFFEVTLYDDLSKTIYELKPDIFWTAYNLINIVKEKDFLKTMRARGIKVFMRMDWPRKKDEIEVIKNEKIVDIYFDEREPESMMEFERQTGRKFHTVTNAANKFSHFPAEPNSKYDYDLVYLGAKLPLKKWFFDNVLLSLPKKYKVGIFGPYWSLKDNIFRVGSKLSRKMRFRKGADFLDKLRITVPPEEEKQLYSSAKICLNFHEREPDGSQPHYILNQRTFKIPACGGFEICDYVPALRKYFDEDEVIMAHDKDDWFEKIEYFLSHDKQREEIRKKGTQRALRDHTYHNRVKQIIDIYERLKEDRL